MATNGNIPPAVEKVDMTSTVLEKSEKCKSHEDDKTANQERAELEEKVVPQEKTNAAQDSAPKKYIILICKDFLNAFLLCTVVSDASYIHTYIFFFSLSLLRIAI
jgi:hypothetical protein